MGEDIPEETINRRLEERRRDDLKDLIRIIHLGQENVKCNISYQEYISISLLCQ